ncbi:MAG: cytidylate kinase-like family protein [Desulfobacterales bacterium]|nr:cytidylate kinase-like family protein [Desulfobacterales bacterium]
MQIICISRGSFGHGKELAESLAKKLGYECISRESITDQATQYGIPVGKIETAVMKHQPITEALGLHIDMFKAFITANLCEKALNNSLVYHGRTGHLVLPGVPHTLKIRAIANMEDRIEMAMARMGLARDKAKKFNEEVDEDIRRWVRTLHNVDWESPSLYDITINSAHLSIQNCASVLVQFASVPEFQETPASRQAIKDLLLESRCRLLIGKNTATKDVKVTVQARKGNVTVTYLPRQEKQAGTIPKVLESVEGIESLVCTIATTNILYIQERFNPKAESFTHLVEVSEKWNAAVELVHFIGGQADDNNIDANKDVSNSKAAANEPHGGILEDTDDRNTIDSGYGISETMNELIQVGRAGGVHTIRGSQQGLASSLSHTTPYSLIVVGDVFLNSGAAVRKRMKRDMISFLSDQFRAPVIGAEELKTEYLFGPKQWLSLGLYGILSVILYMVLFTYQVPILHFFTGTGTVHRMFAAGIVSVFAPVAAIIIGGFAHNVLKLVKLE